jgi:hypothetical protein
MQSKCKSSSCYLALALSYSCPPLQILASNPSQNVITTKNTTEQRLLLSSGPFLSPATSACLYVNHNVNYHVMQSKHNKVSTPCFLWYPSPVPNSRSLVNVHFCLGMPNEVQPRTFLKQRRRWKRSHVHHCSPLGWILKPQRTALITDKNKQR